MSPGVTFERVYLALKEQLGSGRFAANEHLDPNALSADLNASITPVRDALHRLVGEGLVEAPRGDGFRTPLITEVGLRHRYRWSAMLLDLAMRGPAAPVDSLAAPEQADLLARTELLFLNIANLSGNPELLAAVFRLNERLRPARRVEPELFPDAEAQYASLSAALVKGDIAVLRRLVAAYHRGRERLAAEIVQRLHERT